MFMRGSMRMECETYAAMMCFRVHISTLPGLQFLVVVKKTSTYNTVRVEYPRLVSSHRQQQHATTYTQHVEM